MASLGGTSQRDKRQSINSRKILDRRWNSEQGRTFEEPRLEPVNSKLCIEWRKLKKHPKASPKRGTAKRKPRWPVCGAHTPTQLKKQRRPVQHCRTAFSKQHGTDESHQGSPPLSAETDFFPEALCAAPCAQSLLFSLFFSDVLFFFYSFERAGLFSWERAMAAPQKHTHPARVHEKLPGAYMPIYAPNSRHLQQETVHERSCQ